VASLTTPLEHDIQAWVGGFFWLF